MSSPAHTSPLTQEGDLLTRGRAAARAQLLTTLTELTELTDAGGPEDLVCVTHRRFLPCRACLRQGDGVHSHAPADVAAVRTYQQGPDASALV